MKSKIFLLTLLMSLALVFSALAAPAVKPVLEKADVEITAQDQSTFKVKQILHLENAQGVKDNMVENLLSKPDGVVVSDFAVTIDGKKVAVTEDEKTYLNKISFALPAGTTEKVTYEVSYLVKLDKDVFTIPMFVPVYPTKGRGEIINMKFTAPEGNYIHDNSFPIISSLPSDNKYATVMNNLPSHVQYVYGPQPSPFVNTYNIISIIVFIILLSLIYWGFKNERAKAPKAAGQGGAH